MSYTSTSLRSLASTLEAIADSIDVQNKEFFMLKARADAAEADAQRMGEENNRLCDENFELERQLKEATCV